MFVHSAGARCVLITLLCSAVLLGVPQAKAQETPQATTAIYLPLVVNGNAATHESTLEEQVVELTNQQRVEHNCAPLTISSELVIAAKEHSQDMAERNYFSHTSPEGETPWDRMEAAGYHFQEAAENIANGPTTAAGVVNAWMESTKGHRENILNCELHEIGVGYAAGTSGTYWTQSMATPLP